MFQVFLGKYHGGGGHSPSFAVAWSEEGALLPKKLVVGRGFSW